MCSNFSKKPRSPGEFTPRPGSQYCFFRAFHLLWDMQVQLKHMVNQNSPHRLQGGSKDVAQVCGETPRRHRAVRMTTEQQQAGAEWVQRLRYLWDPSWEHPCCPFCQGPLSSSSHWQNMSSRYWSAASGEAYGEGTGCCWSHSRNGKISCVKLCVCMFIHRCLIL